MALKYWIKQILSLLVLSVSTRGRCGVSLSDFRSDYSSAALLQNNANFELFPAHVSQQIRPISETRHVEYEIMNPKYFYHRVTATGHVTTVTNPQRTFSVLEPGRQGGCARNIRDTVENSAKQRECLVAQNGGFFDIVTDGCLGNLVSDGRVVQTFSNLKSVNFGITRNGSIVVGYLTSKEIYQFNFLQLIGGVAWLVRNGFPFVEESMEYEGREVQTTGSVRIFADVRSGRSAVGHDHLGRIILVNIEGRTGISGLSLNEFSRLLIDRFNVVNAINLDGGGSVTTVLNGTLSNRPTDKCPDDPNRRCARNLSSILCVHDYDKHR